MKQSKICTLETYILLTNAINLREGYPIKLANGYQAKSYLPEPEAAKHPVKNLYFIVKDEVTEIITETDDKYFVIVQVFSTLSNAKTFMSSIDGLRYLEYNNKYYVYLFSSNKREDAESFRTLYKNDCWILDLE